MLFINSKLVTQMQHTLAEMGHPQSPILVQIDNSTAYSIVTNKIIPKATKVMEMRFYWLHDCKWQQQFRFYWWPGNNLCQLLYKPPSCCTSQTHETSFLNTGDENTQQNSDNKNSSSGTNKTAMITHVIRTQMSAPRAAARVC